MNEHSVSDISQIEIYTAERLVPDPSSFEVEISIATFKKSESPGNNQILAKLMYAAGGLWSEIHKLIILYGIRKNCLASGRSALTII